MAPWLTPWRVLPGLLLGLDARHARRRCRQSGRNGSAHRGYGDRKDDARRQASEPRHRDHPATARGPVASTSFLANKGGSISSLTAKSTASNLPRRNPPRRVGSKGGLME